jgi:hypothetical protein
MKGVFNIKSRSVKSGSDTMLNNNKNTKIKKKKVRVSLIFA